MEDKNINHEQVHARSKPPGLMSPSHIQGDSLFRIIYFYLYTCILVYKIFTVRKIKGWTIFLVNQGFLQECLRGKGSKRGGGSSPRRKILVLKMAYFNWNDSKIWNIFVFFLPPRGGVSPSAMLSGGPPIPLAEILGLPPVHVCTCTVDIIRKKRLPGRHCRWTQYYAAV